jgi:hypothetical protein
MTTTSPLDTQANQMADEFADCVHIGPVAKARFAQSIKPLLERLHAQATQLTLAQHFASENERLKAENAKQSARLSALMELCGYVQNGSDQVVSIYQDDATYNWFVSVGNSGKRYWFGSTFYEAIDAAMQAEKEKQ